ncbi:MAG TPA: NAD(P)-binding protein [Solirubrobacteraceae bacterium]|nr:NAD(P)-binding protein [Solirubrobacteraceae bacterium]
MRDPRHEVLFEPVRLGRKTMRNRFYQTPHADGLNSQFPGAEAGFRGMKAEGGWAVVNTGMTSVSPEYDHSGREVVSRIWDDADVRNWALLCDRLHEHGALAGIELMASGAHVTGYETRLPAGAVSEIPDDWLFMGSSFQMDKDDIRRVQGHYVAAANRARAAGFDIVNVMGAELVALPMTFLMSRYNQRSDEYGGSFENRSRFWLETLELVRAAVGDDCAITARMCIDTLDDSEHGIRAEHEGAGFIRLADHLVDFWDVQVGGEGNTWGKDLGPSRFYAENFQGEYVRRVRTHTMKPVVAVGRFTSPDTMVQVIRDGQQDIIGAARSSISDPFLPEKISEGRLDEIRECIGCNVCVSRVNTATRIICTQNATTGEEYRRGWHPERFTPVGNGLSRVLVVGAGPAGLECGVVLARRGVEYVHVVDAADRPGGHMEWVPRLPGLAEWARVIHHRLTLAGKLPNLTVIPRKALSADEILDYGAEIVILTTGSTWARDGLSSVTRAPLPGADAEQPHVLTPDQIMVEGKAPPGERVLVYDAEGYFMGVSLAERYAREGRRVRYVTPRSAIAPYMHHTGEDQLMIPLLVELGVELVRDHAVTAIEPGVVCGVPRLPGGRPVPWQADAIVLVTQRIPRSELYRELKARSGQWPDAGVRAVYRAGDCVSPRPQVADAIFDAHRLAREIDSPDPATPLPWVREERFIGTSDADYDSMRVLATAPSSAEAPTASRLGFSIGPRSR